MALGTMLGSLKVGTIQGIPIRLHVTLLAMAALLLVRYGLFGIPAGLILFGSVLLHELGHALVAQSYGIRIASIDLHLLGGMALMTRPPRTAREEIWIAAAGPAVSFALGVAFAVLTFLTGASLDFGAPRLVDLLAYGAAINVAMGFFNLIPALPMDGGRIFRAALTPRFGGLRATAIAARVSRVFAAIFVVVGLAYQMWSLALIGGLLFLMVSNEERVARAQEELKREGLTPDPLGLAHYAQASRGMRSPILDVGPRPGPSRPGETCEVFVDPYGRRYVVITRLES